MNYNWILSQSCEIINIAREKNIVENGIRCTNREYFSEKKLVLDDKIRKRGLF
jgi:hypothetical protein